MPSFNNLDPWRGTDKSKKTKYKNTGPTSYEMTSGLTLWNPAGGSPYSGTTTSPTRVSAYSGGGGASASRRFIGSTLPQSRDYLETTVYSGEMPEIGELPSFVAPEWNEKEIRKLTQKYGAPEARKLRRAMQVAATRSYENPNVKRMALREALQGYGQGIENVMRGASQQARAAYQTKYNQLMTARRINYETALREKFATYENAWRKYFASGTTVRTSQPSATTNTKKLTLRDIYNVI